MNGPSEKIFKSVEQQSPDWPPGVTLENNELVGSLPDITQALLSGRCPANLSINLNRKRLGIDHIKSIANTLASGKCQSQLSLNLTNNQLGVEAANHFATALVSGQCPADLSLDLSYNNLGTQGLHHITTELESGQCPIALSLNLSYSQLGAEDARYFSTALTSGQCPTSLLLNLSTNNLFSEGAQHITKALVSNGCTLGFILHLRYSKMPSTSTETLINALQQNYHVYDLILDTNDEQTEQLHTLLQRNRQFLASQIIPIAQSLHHPHLLSMLNLPPPIWKLVFSYVSWLTQRPQCHVDVKHNSLFAGVLASVRHCYDERRQYQPEPKDPTNRENEAADQMRLNHINTVQ